MSIAAAHAAPAERTLTSAERPSVSRAELAVLAFIVLAGFVARFWAFAATGMSHFDEGVYAISASGLVRAPYDLFPNQINFSPPFYFTTVAVALRLFGGEPDRAAVLVNILLGTATVAAVWWIGRLWFGARAAVIAAALLALNQFHILMSRVVLTDAAFSLWFVLAIATITLAIDRRDYRLAVLAGFMVGMAWNTKYHGWFALLITGVALAPTLWRERAAGGWRRPLAVWTTCAAVAALAYVPWAAYIRIYSGGGGYGSIISYYATMLRIDWLGNVARQAMQQSYLEGTLTRAAPLIALGAGLVVRPTRAASRLALLIAALAVGALLIGQAGVAAALGLASVPLLFREFDRYRSRVLLCWVGLWVVLAPVYHPYARLILPFMIATFLLAGFVIDRLLGQGDPTARRNLAGLAFAAGGVIAALSSVLRSDVGDPWYPSRDLARAATAIAEATTTEATVHVIGEPALVHYLNRLGRSAPPRVDLAVLDTLSTPAYVVTGVYTRRAPFLRDRVAAMGERLTPLATVRFQPNDLRLLDDFRPSAARDYRAAPDSTFDMTLYRLAPAGR